MEASAIDIILRHDEDILTMSELDVRVIEYLIANVSKILCPHQMVFSDGTMSSTWYGSNDHWCNDHCGAIQFDTR